LPEVRSTEIIRAGDLTRVAAGERLVLCVAAFAVVFMALSLATLCAVARAQETRVICVVVDDLGLGTSDWENSAKLLAVLRDEVLKESDLIGFASTGPSAVVEDLQSASTHTLQRAMERLAAAAPPDQSQPRGQSLGATRVALGTVSDIVGNLTRLQNRDKQFLLLTSRAPGDGSFPAAFAQASGTSQPDLTSDVAALVAAAKAGNVTLRVVSTADPEGPALLRALR